MEGHKYIYLDGYVEKQIKAQNDQTPVKPDNLGWHIVTSQHKSSAKELETFFEQDTMCLSSLNQNHFTHIWNPGSL